MTAPSNSTYTSDFPQHQGFHTFKTALDQSPDVISLLKTMAVYHPSDNTAHKKAGQIQKELKESKHRSRPSSGHKYGLFERFKSRPSSAPGPGQYVSRRLSVGGCKIQSRHETKLEETTPGPQTYRLPEPKDTTLGLMARDAKYKDNVDFYQTFLGPGSYELMFSHRSGGMKFAKEGRESELNVRDRQPTTGLRDRHELCPGPGQYSSTTSTSGRAYSIPRAQRKYHPLSSTLGPGAYSFLSSHDSIDSKFSELPRFGDTLQESFKRRTLCRVSTSFPC